MDSKELGYLGEQEWEALDAKGGREGGQERGSW